MDRPHCDKDLPVTVIPAFVAGMTMEQLSRRYSTARLAALANFFSTRSRLSFDR